MRLWYSSLRSVRRASGLLRFALCCLPLLCVGLFSAFPAQAGEVITWPGNGVLQTINIPVVGAFPNSLGPSASSPSGNSVTISGGTFSGTTYASSSVFGGYSGSSTVAGNSVVISGGTFGGASRGVSSVGAVYGGYSNSGNVVGNRVVVSGGRFDGPGSSTNVTGGATFDGDATGNSVVISGGTFGTQGDFTGWVVGGQSTNGASTGNSVVIRGGTFGGAGNNSGVIVGGRSQNASSSATHNTVTILGSPVFGSSVGLYGGYTGGGGTDLRTGNTLNFFSSGHRVKTISNFQYYNFALPTDGSTSLTVTDNTNFLNGDVLKAPYALSGHALSVGQSVTLLHRTNGLNTTNLSLVNGQAKQGVSLVYDYTLSTSANSISATVTGVQVAPESKAIAESRAASMAFANLGADLIAGAGLANARTATTARERELSGGDNGTRAAWGLAPFFAVSASSLRYNSGSHADVGGVALMAGLAKTWQTSAADVLVGAFFEAAFGTSQTRNSFGAGSVDGKGDNKAVGGGLLARVDMTDTVLKGLYGEASVRIGSLTGRYNNEDLRDIMGNAAAYDINSTYYGAHAGLGYIWNFNESASLDLYGKYFWTHQAGQDVSIMGDGFSFKDMDSQRVKLGGRLSYAVTETVTPYIGVAWEYEFDGEAKASTYGFDVPAPSIKGSTGVGEIGLNWKPSNAQGFSVDMAMQGYTGQREGVSGTLQLKYEF